MNSLLEPFVLAFIQIFVAVDAIGNVPLFVSLTEGASKAQKRKIVIDSVTTAAAVAVLFMFIGKIVLSFLGITIADFQIAGGALLFIIAVRLLLPGQHQTLASHNHDRQVGVFPLGTPLITGPAVLTTTLMMLDSYGLGPTFVSLTLNMLVVWVSLDKAELVMKTFGPHGTRAFAKIMYILLAAIGVMMVRRGIQGVWM